jgi:excisionase family DNA binding protein
MAGKPRKDIEPALLTVAQAAAYLGISRSLAYVLVNSRQVPSLKIGAATRVPRAGLDAWIAARTR